MERGEFSMVNQSEPLLDHGGMDKGEFMMNQLEDMDATDNQFGLLELDADGGSPSGVETNASSVELTNENKEMFDLEQQNGCCYESFNFSCEKLPKMEEMIRIKENWEEVQPLVNNCSKSILVDMVIDTMLQAARTELQRMEEVARRVVYLLENMVQMAKHLNTAYKQHKARKIGQKVAAKVAAEKWVKAEKAAQIERKLKEERFLKEAELQRKEYENQEKEAADKERVVETHQAMVTAIPDPKDPVTLAMTLFKQGIDAQLAEMRRQNEEAHRRQEEAQRQYEDFLQKQLQLIHKQQSSEVKSFQMTVDALFAVVKEGEVRRAMLEEIVLKDRADVAERLKVGGSSNKGSNKREREEDKEIDASKKKRHEEQGKDQN